MSLSLVNRVGRVVLGMPDPLARLLAGAPLERDGRTLDAQAQLALVAQRLLGDRPAHERSVEGARRAMEVNSVVLAPPKSALASVADRAFAGVACRVYRPNAPTNAALVFLHGGGHALGSLDSHDVVCRVIAAATPCVVVAVDYRLAPDHRFPAAADDATAAFRAIAAEAAALSIDPQRIAVGGDSAGGNLAAVVALDTRADALRPRAQLLIYPVVDETMSSPSLQTFARGFFLEKETIAWFRDHYLGGHDRADPRASPLFADVKGAPPAIVITAGFDPLRDEGDAYAKKLADAGVAVSHRCYPSLFHGFWNTTGVIRAARAAVDEGIALLRAAL